ncbi:MAG: FlgD immunoglobulin-like domain containing protein [Candidatus Krumholzibacteria bacterium]|nr:FlgD immunoglobulin-like domain containing protein [Candidatus Krumholzibacteria bacterium]
MRLSAIVFSILLLCALSARAQVASTFDTDLDGWKINGDNTAVWQATGGNPGGCLDVNDQATGGMNWAIAPRKFLGDWSGFALTDSICFDIYEVNTSGGAWVDVEHIWIEGPGGRAWTKNSGLAIPPPTGVWLNAKIPIDPAYWTVTEGTWEGLVSDVTSVRIFAEWVDGGETTWLDNIRLTATPVEVFSPCLSNTFNASGIGDWTFRNAGAVSNPGSGGNGGGYARVGDATGNSYGIAPPAFLGDWSAVDGAGYMTVDIRILSSSGTNLGSPDFIRISGPGGAAHVSLSADDLTIPSRVWKTFAFPIDEASWTMESGTWAALLAQVDECRIDLEYFDGSETVGFDNFGRLMNDCPAIDDLVTVHDPGMERCGISSLVGVSTVALNPMDSELYGLLRESSGGMFMVNGPTAGVIIASYNDPAHLIFAPDGDAFISEDYSGYIYRKAWGGASSLWVSGFHSGDDDPYGMTIAPPGFDGPNVNPGDILVSDRGYSGPDQIWSFSPDVAEGELLVMDDPGEVDFCDLAAGAYDTVYVCDRLDSTRIYVLVPDGTLTSFALDSPIDGLVSIVYDPVLDDLYVASTTSESVHRVEPVTGVTTLVADGFSSFHWCCLEFDAEGRRLIVADNGYNRVYEFCLEPVTGVDEEIPAVPGLDLRAYPNPFNPAVTISFSLDRASDVRLGIYDAAGRHIVTLRDGTMGPGEHRIAWDGCDGRGNRVAAAIYFARIEALGIVASRKVVLLR